MDPESLTLGAPQGYNLVENIFIVHHANDSFPLNALSSTYIPTIVPDSKVPTNVSSSTLHSQYVRKWTP